MVYVPKKIETYKADEVETEVVETDVLVIGGGFSGCGAAYEAAYWAKLAGLKITLGGKIPSATIPLMKEPLNFCLASV